jgi:signal transduction histidine kinase
MRERLRQFQGELIIESNSSGTTVVVTIPISQSLGSADTTESFESSISDN